VNLAFSFSLTYLLLKFFCQLKHRHALTEVSKGDALHTVSMPRLTR